MFQECIAFISALLYLHNAVNQFFHGVRLLQVIRNGIQYHLFQQYLRDHFLAAPVFLFPAAAFIIVEECTVPCGAGLGNDGIPAVTADHFPTEKINGRDAPLAVMIFL